MPMMHRRERTVLVLLTVAFLLSGMAFALAIPMFANPDESSHVDMVRHYAHHPTEVAGPSLRQSAGVRGAVEAAGILERPFPDPTAYLPSSRPDYGSFDDYGGNGDATECPQRTCQQYQFIHPPAWYLLMAPVARVLDARPFPETVAALRLLNVAMSSVIVFATWFTARQLWPTRRRLALVAAGLTAVCGPLAAAASSANNDGLLLPLMAVAIALMAGILRRGVTTRSAAVLGIVVSLGLLTKGEFLVAAGVAVLAMLVAPAASWAVRWRGLAALTIAGVPGGLWWLRVIVREHGLTPGGSEFLAPERTGSWNHEWIGAYFVRRFGDLIDWLPGKYGYYPGPFVVLPPALRIFCQLGALALIVGWLACRRWRRPTMGSVRVLVLVALPVLLVLASVVSSWDAYRRNGYFYGMAPRYAYGAVPVLAVMLTAALAAVGDRFRPLRPARFHAGLLAATAVIGVGAALAMNLRATYFTTDLALTFRRAGVIAPVTHPKAWLALLAVGWTAVLAGAAWQLLTDRIGDPDR